MQRSYLTGNPARTALVDGATQWRIIAQFDFENKKCLKRYILQRGSPCMHAGLAEQNALREKPNICLILGLISENDNLMINASKITIWNSVQQQLQPDKILVLRPAKVARLRFMLGTFKTSSIRVAMIIYLIFYPNNLTLLH
jgi:hypothetical protein